MLQMENGNSQLSFFDENRNGKRKFVFLGRQTINGNQYLLFQQMCPSMGIGIGIRIHICIAGHKIIQALPALKRTFNALLMELFAITVEGGPRK
jgi:hypothetical protein